MPIDVSRSLFIKNDAGEFVPVPMLKGEPGPKGDTGDPGPKGEPGSDANVTFENITNALGYVAADDEFVQEQAQEISQINESITDISNGYRLISLVENEYVTTGGAIKPYIGWARTDYVEIEGDFIKISAAESSRYNCWFDSDRNYLGHFDLNVGVNRIPVYYGASYFMLSSTISGMKSTKVWDETHLRLDSIESTVPEVFVAKYGVTPYADVVAAIEAGKIVLAKLDINTPNPIYYHFTRYFTTSGYVHFAAYYDKNLMQCTVRSNDVWSNGNVQFSSAIASEPSRHNLPTEKAVYDFMAAPSQMPTLTESEQAAARQRIGLENRFELIDTIDLSKITSVLTLTSEPNGTPYRFSAIILQCCIKAGSTNSPNVNIITNSTVQSRYAVCYYSASATADRYATTSAEILHGALKAQTVMGVNGFQYQGTAITTPYGVGMVSDHSHITGITLSHGTGNIYTDGSYIEIYGLRI